MKSRTLFFLLFILSTGIKAQNLVPNPSFEDVDSLYCNLDDGTDIDNYLQFWELPYYSTTDLYSTLLPPNCTMNPLTSWPGVIRHTMAYEPEDGNNMIGILTFEDGGTTSYREYIEVPLKEKLLVGKLYTVSCYIRLGINFTNQATNNIGVYFSEEKIDPENYITLQGPLPFKPQILWDEVIINSDNWVQYMQCFMADKEFAYLTIGNFSDDDNTKIVEVYPSSDQNNWKAYYYIDNVSVVESPAVLNFTLGQDTTLCQGEQLVLQTPGGGIDYTWQDGSTQTTYTVNSTGTYWVEASFEGCTYRDSIAVYVMPSIELGADTLLCYGEVLDLVVEHPLNDFLWSDGTEKNHLLVDSPGLYSVEVGHSRCTITDTIEVNFMECPGFIPNLITPNGDNNNEYFEIENINNRSWQLVVYNRWGVEVYHSNHYTNDWDGHGLTPGVYYYKLQASSPQKIVKGWVKIVN